MRILAVTNLYPNPFQPNRSTFNSQQFKALAKLCPLRIISPISWVEEWSAARKSGPVMPASRRQVRDGIDVEHPRYLFPPRMLRAWYGHFYRRSIQNAFRAAVKEFRPDMVLASWAFPDGWAVGQLARQAGLPVVIKVHGSDVLLLQQQNRRRQRLTASALRAANGVIAVSRDLQRSVIEMGVSPQKVQVIYNGVDTSVFIPSSVAEARTKLSLEAKLPTLLFIGNLVPVKGLDVLIDACSVLARDGLQFACYLIGTGSLQDTLNQQIHARGLTDRIKLIGVKPHHELPQWFAAADLFVLPSRSEGIPNVLLEASACGTPYVASRVGGIPEIAALGDGQLVPPGDAEALANAIRLRLSAPAQQRSASQAHIRGHAQAAAEVLDFLTAVKENRV